LVVGELATVRTVPAAGLVEQRMETSRRLTRSRGHARVEVEIDADGAALFGFEGRQIAELFPSNRSRQGLPRSFSRPLATYTIRNNRPTYRVYYY
jgi:hypothetical protein